MPPAPGTRPLGLPVALALLALLAPMGAVGDVRKDIIIVGSSTVYPFTSFVAEYFGLTSQYPAPRVESTGTGGGFKYFCSGAGLAYPDINNASRAIKPSEVELCRRNGVERLLEITIGLDSIVVAARRDSPLANMSLDEVYAALARWLPDADSGAVVENPHRLYSDINPDYPALPIRVLGPPPTSGTRDAFVELVLERACVRHASMAALRKSAPQDFKRYCLSMREDGAFIEAGENDNLILRKVSEGESGTLGLIGFSFYIQNRDIVKAVRVDGIAPSRSSILSRRYPISRPLFVYLKSAHIDLVPGLASFVDLFLSDFIIGANAQLGGLGLITPGARALERMRQSWERDKRELMQAPAGARR